MISSSRFVTRAVARATAKHLAAANSVTLIGSARPRVAASRLLATMACRQCEQTQDSVLCSTIGVCGKEPQTAAIQDLLVYQAKGLGAWAVAARAAGVDTSKVDDFLPVALFATMTNVNFDSDRCAELVQQAAALRSELVSAGVPAPTAAAAQLDVASATNGAFDAATLEQAARSLNVGVLETAERMGADRGGVQELLVYGMKGLCAYWEHARQLGVRDDSVSKQLSELLAVAADEDKSLDELVGAALSAGELNFRITLALEAAHKDTFGAQEPTAVRTHGKQGKAILVSGHDMRDLELVLKATEGKGINVYTHGEMLPGNAYPELKKYPHFVGHYGTAWQNQKFEFATFPGAILMTTNCIIKPMKSYKHRIFTRSAVGWPGVTHLTSDDMTPVIDAAMAEDGFAKDEPETPPLTIGYGKDTILAAAGDVVSAVKAGKINHFWFIGGCDGTEGERSVFTDIAKSTKDDHLILTAGCAKFRFNRLLEGQTVAGLPKVLDAGQCNDISGVVGVATALSEAFECGVNDLPLSLAVSWLEQKAVAQLLTCLHLGITDIKLGPNLPAFITPAVLGVLVEKFKIAPTSADIQKDFPGLLKATI